MCVCGVSVPLCPQIDRYLKDKTLTRRWLPSKAQLMSTTVCRPSKTNSARFADLERETFSFLFFLLYFTLPTSCQEVRDERSFVGIEKRKGEREKKKRNKRGHKSRGVKRFRLVGDNSVSETISFL